MKKTVKKISYFRNKADRAFQTSLTTLRPKCEMCGQLAVCQHHYFTRASSSALRYDEQNAISVCSGCHLGFHSNRSAIFNARVIENRGVKWVSDLIKRRNTFIKPNKKYYEDIIKFYS